MPSAISVSPLDAQTLPLAGEFLHEHLNGRLSAQEWVRALTPPWGVDAADHGLCLRDGERLVGVYAAFRSERVVDDRPVTWCNLAAWCVLDEHRAHGLRLLRGLLASGADVYTDLSPSGSVVGIDERLGFRHLDTTSSLRLNIPWPQRGVQVVTDARRVEALLSEPDAAIHRDHVGALAVRHVVVVLDDGPCYIVYRRVRRKGLPLFASVVHVGEPRLFRRAVGPLGAHLLVRGMPMLLAEHRLVGGPLPLSVTVAGRPKMFRSAALAPEQIDDLYSEIACVPW